MSKRKRGRRGLRVALASAIAALGVSAVGVSSASAATVTLDHGFLKIALPDAFEIITTTGTDPTGPVVLTGFDPDVDGDYTVEVADVDFPQFSGELFGTPLTVDVTPLANLTGNYNAATGALTGDTSNWESVIDFGGSPCTITPIPLAFTTNTNTVFNGDAFDAASLPPTTGAISDDWASLPAGTPTGNCGLIDQATNAPGGLWLSNGVLQPSFVPPPPDPPATPTPPATPKKKCKKKKKKGKSASAAAGCKKKKKKKKK